VDARSWLRGRGARWVSARGNGGGTAGLVRRRCMVALRSSYKGINNILMNGGIGRRWVFGAGK
jgi:hypothetical protein